MKFNPNQPLGLPKGSVRSILALIVMIPFTVIAFRSGVQLSGDQLIGVMSLVLLAYFNSKTESNS